MRKKKDKTRISFIPLSEGKEGSEKANPLGRVRASLLGPSSASNLKSKGTKDSPPRGMSSTNRAWVPKARRTWAQAVQGLRRFG